MDAWNSSRELSSLRLKMQRRASSRQTMSQTDQMHVAGAHVPNGSKHVSGAHVPKGQMKVAGGKSAGADAPTGSRTPTCRAPAGAHVRCPPFRVSPALVDGTKYPKEWTPSAETATSIDNSVPQIGIYRVVSRHNPTLLEAREHRWLGADAPLPGRGIYGDHDPVGAPAGGGLPTGYHHAALWAGMQHKRTRFHR
ncbi:MAG: hypothetical protein QOF48_1180 [Verrucomicrobiota bacterium]|jgi:hypothetical protein